MTENEAKRLAIGDRVMFRDDLIPNEDNGSEGVVIARDYARFKVRWEDDGSECSFPHILAMCIHRAED
jgi:hypothetical protein